MVGKSDHVDRFHFPEQRKWIVSAIQHGCAVNPQFLVVLFPELKSWSYFALSHVYLIIYWSQQELNFMELNFVVLNDEILKCYQHILGCQDCFIESWFALPKCIFLSIAWPQNIVPHTWVLQNWSHKQRNQEKNVLSLACNIHELYACASIFTCNAH